MLFCSPFLHVTVWPNLFFWACHGKAAHPANMPDEVWSLHPNPALLPSAHIPAQLSSLPEVDVTHRHRLRGQMEASLSVPKTSEADHDISQHSYVTSSHGVADLPCRAGKNEREHMLCSWSFYLAEQNAGHRIISENQLVQGGARKEGQKFGRIMLNSLFHVWQSCFLTTG